MKHQKLSALHRPIVAVAILLLFSLTTYSQVQTARSNAVNANCGGYYEYLPKGYSTSQSYPLIVAVHGIGELGNGTTDLSRLLNCWTALPRRIANGGFPASVTVGTQSFSFIVISPQFKAWPSASDVNAVVDYAIQHYKVDQSRIYVTGLSMGGGSVWDFASAYPTKAAAVVPVCGARSATAGGAQAIANAKLPVWATHNNSDPTVSVNNTIGWINLIKQDGGDAISSIFQATVHDAWTKTYDPAFTQNGVNIYQWMLQHKKGSTTVTTPTTSTTTPTSSAISISTSTSTHIEAENWSGMSGVQTASTTDVGGGKLVGWIGNGDWMDYSVSVSSAGSYTINLRLATPYSGSQLQIKNSSGTVLGTVNVPTTGGFESWKTVPVSVNLSSGVQTIRIQCSSSAGYNINWFEIAGSSGTVTTGTSSGNTSTTTHIEAEDYTNMSGVQTASTTDVGGGKLVGWIGNGDWMDYSVSVSSAGSYTINLRLATPYSGSQLQIKNSSGTVLGTVNVPTTGGFESWKTVPVSVNLSSGVQTIRIQCSSSAGYNINWFEIAGSSGTVTTGTSSGNTSTSTHIEAEDYTNMSGVQTASTTDVGGGKLVGWIGNGDWMDYSVSVSSAGSYTINLRLATPYSGSQLQIKNSSGTVLGTVNVPTTGGFESWKTVPVSVNLSSGVQTIRIQCSSSAGYNINWFEIAQGSAAITSRSVSTATELSSATTSEFSVYPNPVINSFQLQINNDLTGSVSVQVYDLSGRLQKQFSLTKADAGSTQFYLSIGELAAANYIIKASMNNWSASQQISKQ